MKQGEPYVRLDPDWKLIVIYSCGCVYALVMTSLGIDAPIPRVPIWVLMIACFVIIIHLWKSFRFSEDGFIISRCIIFRRNIRWNQVQQIVHTTLGKGSRRRSVTIIVLRTAPRWPKLDEHSGADGYILPNVGHIFVLNWRDWETKKAVLEMIANNWEN